ncbi:MAG: hypothetical protein CME70_17305 [Halobacteriovorax sp.]|nr:hypothetical protein [Halobacteriovorax sp.]
MSLATFYPLGYELKIKDSGVYIKYDALRKCSVIYSYSFVKQVSGPFSVHRSKDNNKPIKERL